jgi:DNA-binding IclR family transcriptional regulator
MAIINYRDQVMNGAIIGLLSIGGLKMAYDPDKIIEVATRLKAAKDEVIRVEEELRRLVVPFVAAPVYVPPEVSTPNRVMELFSADPSKNFSAEDVWRKLGIKESYARPLLSRMVSDGRIEKRGRGAYGAVGGSKQKSLESVDSRPVQ